MRFFDRRLRHMAILFLVATSLVSTCFDWVQAQDPSNPFYKSFVAFGTDQTRDSVDNVEFRAEDVSYFEGATPSQPVLALDQTDFNGAKVSLLGSSQEAGYLKAKNYVQLAVTSLQPDGYYLVAGRGSHVQAKFQASSAIAEVEYVWEVTGSSSTPFGAASGRIDFAAGVYPTTDFNGFFSLPQGNTTGQRMSHFGPGTYSYRIPVANDQVLDLFYWSSAYIQLQDFETALAAGTSIFAEADFSNTYVLQTVNLYDSNGDLMNNWSMIDVASNKVMFDPQGRTPAADNQGPVEVEIDLLHPKTIRLNSSGSVSVAIISSAEFDSRQVDWKTIELYDPMAITAGGKPVQPTKCTVRDVNCDGRPDVVLKFNTRDIRQAKAFKIGSTSAFLEGQLKDGTEIQGVTQVTVRR